MHSRHAAFSEAREILRRTSCVSGRGRVFLLTCELLRALARAHDAENRSRTLRRELDFYRSLGAYSRPELRLRFALLHRRLADARFGRPSSVADRRSRLQAIQLELLEMVVHCNSLHAGCSILLRKLDPAHDRDCRDPAAAAIVRRDAGCHQARSSFGPPSRPTVTIASRAPGDRVG